MNTGTGIQFNGDGPMMSGTWYNPQTGHKFTVRDCFFEDGNFIVMATNGQRYDYNTIRNYIQCNDADGKSIEPDPTVMAPKTQQVQQNLPPEVAGILATDDTDPYAQYMVPEDMDTNPLTKGLTGPGLGNLNDRHIAPAPNHTTPHTHFQGYVEVVDDKSEDFKMIDRVLRRHPVPDFEAELKWACPEKQIETLVDVLGIEPALIAEYYVGKLDKDAIFAAIQAKLTAYINQQWMPATVSAATTIDPSIIDPIEEPARPKSKPKAKAIKKTK